MRLDSFYHLSSVLNLGDMYTDAKWLKLGAMTIKPQVASRWMGDQSDPSKIHIMYQLITGYMSCVYGGE